jgi:hypothetical protein
MKVIHLPRPSAWRRLVCAVRDLLGRPESREARARRLAIKAEVERKAKERL